MTKIVPITSKINYYNGYNTSCAVNFPITIFGNIAETPRVLLPGQDAPNKTLKQVLYDEQLKLNKITNRYNLINTPAKKNSETLNDAIFLSNSFINKYGVLDSSSREELLLTKYPDLSPSKSTLKRFGYILKEREYSSNEIQMANNISELMLKYHAGNCGDCTYVLNKMGYEQFNDKYNILTINFYATVGCRGVSHVAMLLASKDGKEEYVVDPWLNPESGGVYRRKDWETMMHKVFDVNINDKNNIVSIFTNDNIHKNMLNQK